MQKYTDSDLETKLKQYEAWQLDAETGKLTTGFEFENFEQAVDFANVIADIAQEQGHHPDLLIHDFKFVTVFTSTHDVNGITDKDLKLMDAIEAELNAE